MIGRFPYRKLVKYPHMSPEDIITWELFIDLFPNAFDSVDYDFPCCRVPEHTKLAIDLNIAGSERVNQYRVDVIGYQGDAVYITELKKRATPAVLGHLKAEKLFFTRDHENNKNVIMLLIARDMTPELDMLAKAEDIHFILLVDKKQ